MKNPGCRYITWMDRFHRESPGEVVEPDRRQFVIPTCHAERRLHLPKLASRHMEPAAAEVCS